MTRAIGRALAGLCLLGAATCGAAPVTAWHADGPLAPAPLLSTAPAPRPGDDGLSDGGSGADALATLKSGHFGAACRQAAAVLAREQADLAALGLYALCRAAANDRAAAGVALERLAGAEPSPYFAPMAQALLQLHERASAAAAARVAPLLAQRPGDALLQYVNGEVQHARGRDDEALRAFAVTLTAWPDFVPALDASARLLGRPGAAQPALLRARSLAERAAALEPMNAAHWQLLADLCERTGQHDRASAIALQWLRVPAAPTAR